MQISLTFRKTDEAKLKSVFKFQNSVIQVQIQFRNRNYKTLKTLWQHIDSKTTNLMPNEI